MPAQKFCVNYSVIHTKHILLHSKLQSKHYLIFLVGVVCFFVCLFQVKELQKITVLYCEVVQAAFTVAITQ